MLYVCFDRFIEVFKFHCCVWVVSPSFYHVANEFYSTIFAFLRPFGVYVFLLFIRLFVLQFN